MEHMDQENLKICLISFNERHSEITHRGSLSSILIGKHGGLFSQVAPQVIPFSKVSLLIDSMAWSKSWSKNWPHCITWQPKATIFNLYKVKQLLN
jgi:hypothetical protein